VVPIEVAFRNTAYIIQRLYLTEIAFKKILMTNFAVTAKSTTNQILFLLHLEPLDLEFTFLVILFFLSFNRLNFYRTVFNLPILTFQKADLLVYRVRLFLNSINSISTSLVLLFFYLRKPILELFAKKIRVLRIVASTSFFFKVVIRPVALHIDESFFFSLNHGIFWLKALQALFSGHLFLQIGGHEAVWTLRRHFASLWRNGSFCRPE